MTQMTKVCLIAVSVSCLAIIALACNGSDGPTGPPGNDGTSDKQIRLTFNGGYSTTDTVATLCYSQQYITRFSKSNYVNVDSIVFGANMGTSSSSSNCIVELYDVTDSVVIAGGTLITNASGFFGDWPWIYSNNLLNSLPDKEISLGFRIRSSQQGVGAQVNTPILFLYRK